MTITAAEARKKYRLSRAMEVELGRLLKIGRVRLSNRSLIALAKRGLVHWNNEKMYQEQWELTGQGKAVAALLR